MFKFTMFSLFSFMLSLFAVAFALPIALRDVFVPPVTSPTTGTIWTIGSQQNVTWYVSQNTLLATNLLIVCYLL